MLFPSEYLDRLDFFLASILKDSLFTCSASLGALEWWYYLDLDKLFYKFPGESIVLFGWRPLIFLKLSTSFLCRYFLLLSINFLSFIWSQSMTLSPFWILFKDFFLFASTNIWISNCTCSFYHSSYFNLFSLSYLI